jgi:tetratricopeptide (TPR) repeat protein
MFFFGGKKSYYHRSHVRVPKEPTMRLVRRNKILLPLILVCALCSVQAQTENAAQDSQTERQKAIELLNQGKHLEALPLLEDLVKQNPEDSQLLLGLATCLVSHAATLEDDNAAVKERVRARELLLKAQELGNNSTLLQNLLQLLPPDGRLAFNKTPADQAMQKGEAAFARNDYPEAIQNYSKALELDPTNYSAALFIGDSYFAEKDWTKASEWYGKAIEISPNTETAYRYYADMLTKNGDQEKARKLAIQAVVAEPYNPITWRGLEQWARSNRLALNDVHINAPVNSVSQGDDKHINITMDPSQPTDTSAVWLSYTLDRAKWRTEEFKKHFPNEKEYRHSLAEEAEALSLAAKVCEELVVSDNKKSKSSSPPKDADLRLLLKLDQAKMIEPYVLLSAPDAGIARDYAAYREKNRATLETYLSDFVVPSAPSH